MKVTKEELYKVLPESLKDIQDPLFGVCSNGKLNLSPEDLEILIDMTLDNIVSCVNREKQP